MNSFRNALYAFLTNAGSSAHGRIYPQQLPQQAQLPAMTYVQVSGAGEYSQSGPSRLVHPRYQIDCWGDGYLAASTLAEEVKQAVDGYRGMMGGFEVGVTFIEDERDNFDPETFRHWVSLDIEIWYSR